ncbi:hypothetical protein I1A36_10450 [Pectobacterium aquaticum]|nr:hypothetical protein [Pectobacterium aquaticum]
MEKNCLEKGAIGMTEGPFSGVTQSGHGSENGIEGIDAYLVTNFTNDA